ncbi:MAG: methyltransferase domain-containing protein [Alphaproteobacteria bacterium]|nr:methyltransferase domain-containing protein [Alphaproteobacteria bacterium]
MTEIALDSLEKRLDLWRGEFGDAYRERNGATESMLRALRGQWSQFLAPVAGAPPRSILEVGANIGLNLRALRALTDAEFYAVEPNQRAADQMVGDGVLPAANVKVADGSNIPFADASVDLAFTSGVLIHIHPSDHEKVCKEMYRVSRRYIGCIEYFADRPREIPYHGFTGALFLRDFGHMWMTACPDLVLRGHGFFWRHAGAADSMNWWLFEKAGA